MAGTRQRIEEDQSLAQMRPVLDALYTHFAAHAEADLGRNA